MSTFGTKSAASNTRCTVNYISQSKPIILKLSKKECFHWLKKSRQGKINFLMKLNLIG